MCRLGIPTNVYVRIIQRTHIFTEIYSITYLHTAFIYKQFVAITCCGFRSRDSAMASDEPLLTFTLQQQHLNYIDFGLFYCKLNSHYLHCNAYKWTFGLYFIIGIHINGLHVKHLVISSTHILAHPYFFVLWRQLTSCLDSLSDSAVRARTCYHRYRVR